MVFQKRPPRLWRRLGDPTGHQVRNRSLGDLDSQFEQLAMNSRSAPERVGLRHLENKLTDFRADRRPPGSVAPGLELIEQLESLSMPPNEGFGFYDDQWLLPVGPESTKQDPEKTVLIAKLRPFDRAFLGGQLLSKRKVLQNDIKSLFESEKNVKEPVQRQLYHG